MHSAFKGTRNIEVFVSLGVSMRTGVRNIEVIVSLGVSIRIRVRSLNGLGNRIGVEG